MKKNLTVILALFVVFLTISVAPAEQSAKETASKTTIKLATTTSVDSSGLLKHILPNFTEKTGIDVDVIAVGSGKALQLARDGNVDIILVHDPESEQKFIQEGYGVKRSYICQNEFVIVGPSDDPAGIKSAKSAVDAFRKIMDSKSKFISRGDQSGTHMRELKIWKEAGIEPSGDWYISAGQGMGPVLTMTSETGAYTLTDTGTYYSMIDKVKSKILFSGDEILLNIYSVITLSREKLPHLKHTEAAKFIDWITSKSTKKMIADFKVNGYQLFKVVEPVKEKTNENKPVK